MKPIILASKSPRRKELLKQIGFDFDIDPSDYQEEKDLDLNSHEIQGLGGILIEKIEGDYCNVVGLPLTALVEELKKSPLSGLI